MHPFGGLPENLSSFCALLRRDYHFRIGTGEVLEAASALGIVNLSDVRAVRDALRPVLAGTREDVAVFDAAFDRFFLAAPAGHPDDEPFVSRLDSESGGDGDETAGQTRTRKSSREGAEELSGAGLENATPFAIGDDEAATAFEGASYSPIEVDSADAPEIASVDEAWIAAARALVRRVQLGRARMWRSARRGRRFDLRRTLRVSLQTGGEPLAPRWLDHPRRAPRFIVLIDGSRSMSQYAGAALKMASALARATSRLEVFTFSTALQQVSAQVRSAVGRKTYRLPVSAQAWGGGTSIGACLAEFVRRFGDRLLTTQAVVIVASDGLDIGEPDTLRASMQTLRRRSAALVWLNPLLDTPGYEPTALGMRTAKPFTTTFSSVNDLAGFVRLSRTLRVRA